MDGTNIPIAAHKESRERAVSLFWKWAKTTIGLCLFAAITFSHVKDLMLIDEYNQGKHGSIRYGIFSRGNLAWPAVIEDWIAATLVYEMWIVGTLYLLQQKRYTIRLLGLCLFIVGLFTLPPIFGASWD